MTTTEMQGTTCLVSGSTSGLGKATAFALARQHATVILGCRDRQRGEAVLAESFLWKIGTFEDFYVALLTARRQWLLLLT
jgi:NAD(P)-dependent dehydrogenase (short-subunit alcohol dehydrogenase family)